MLGHFTPSSWFFIFLALLLSCYIKMAQHRIQKPSFNPFVQATFFKRP